MQIEINGELRKTKILLNESAIQERVQKIAQEINQHYPPHETLVVLVVLNGAFVFAADLVRHLQMPTEIESIRIRSYVGVQSTGCIELLSPLPHSIVNKNVLIVEDIIDTGRSMDFLLKALNAHGVKSVRVCTLLNKPHEHLIPIQAHYTGFEIGKNFVIGYGLDLDGKYRNLPHIVEII